ncbi:hypothetical protein KP509_1Z123700 [Ceratopteris richardii]|nr:hypothetical protein KP509_1Z123700 [Ceratopteris richardii]
MMLAMAKQPETSPDAGNEPWRQETGSESTEDVSMLQGSESPSACEREGRSDALESPRRPNALERFHSRLQSHSFKIKDFFSDQTERATATLKKTFSSKGPPS